MSIKKLYGFNFDCGRMGSLEGLFIANETDVQKVIGSELYFGEALGKHSEISGPLEDSNLKVVSEDQDFINKLRDLLGDTLSGYNPLEYVEDDEGED